jgi:hypothetical protein
MDGPRQKRSASDRILVRALPTYGKLSVIPPHLFFVADRVQQSCLSEHTDGYRVELSHAWNRV